MGRDAERGYALVAAVTAVAAFAYIAFQVLAQDQGAVAEVRGRIEQAKLAAASDAGIMIAIHGLADDDPSERWSIDGRMRRVDFDGVDLAVSVEDERGKAPLGGLSDGQSRALFEGAGASGGRLEALVDEYRDWVAHGAGQPFQGADSSGAKAPRLQSQPFGATSDLLQLQDMDASLYARIAPAVTTFFEQGGPFDPAYASPLAIQTMSAQGGRGPEEILAGSGFANERPDEDIAQDSHLVGRTLTVRVWAQGQDGARAHRMAIVELTGSKATPYWIRYAE